MSKSSLLTALLVVPTMCLHAFAQAERSEPHPEETAAIQHLQQAGKAMEAGDVSSAIANLKQATELVPDNMDYRYQFTVSAH